MSDSIRKYNELVEDGLIKPNDNKLGAYITPPPMEPIIRSLIEVLFKVLF